MEVRDPGILSEAQVLKDYYIRHRHPYSRRVELEVESCLYNLDASDFHKDIDELERSKRRTYLKSPPIVLTRPDENLKSELQSHETDSYVSNRVRISLIRTTMMPLLFSLFLVTGTSMTVIISMPGDRFSALREHMPQLILFGFGVFAVLWLPTILFWVRSLPSLKSRAYIVSHALQSLNQQHSDVQDMM